MKILLIFNIIGALFTYEIRAQDVSKIFGTYNINVISIPYTYPELTDTFNYETKIESSTVDSFDFQFYLPVGLYDTVRATLLDDSSFKISYQFFTYTIQEDTFYSAISGEGFLQNDSITINYILVTQIGAFSCYSRGVKQNGTNVKPNFWESNIRLYPNPVKEYLTVSNTLNTPICKIELFDLSGRKVKIWSDLMQRENVLQIESVLPGIYLLKIETEFGTETKKLVVQ